jgi:hypothetical protein
VGQKPSSIGCGRSDELHQQLGGMRATGWRGQPYGKQKGNKTPPRIKKHECVIEAESMMRDVVIGRLAPAGSVLARQG